MTSLLRFRWGPSSVILKRRWFTPAGRQRQTVTKRVFILGGQAQALGQLMPKAD